MEYNYRCHQSRQGWILWEQPRKVWNLSQHYKLDAFSFNHTSSICYPETKTINFQKIIISMSIFLLSKSHVLFAGECTTIFCKKIASEWNGSSSINRASVQPGLEEVLFFYLLITFLLILLVAKAGVLWYIYHSITKLGWLIRVHIIQLISMIFQGYGGVGTSFICSSNMTNLFQRCAYWHVLYMCLI